MSDNKQSFHVTGRVKCLISNQTHDVDMVIEAENVDHAFELAIYEESVKMVRLRAILEWEGAPTVELAEDDVLVIHDVEDYGSDDLIRCSKCEALDHTEGQTCPSCGEGITERVSA